MKLNTDQTGFVALEGRRVSVLTTLDGIDEWVGNILNGFAVILTGTKIGPLKLGIGPKRI